MRKTDSSSISFTAYYTGEVWRQHGLSSDLFATRTGRVLYTLGRPVEAIAQTLAGASIGTTLLQRHHIIDAIVKRAIEQQGVCQVVEIACGLSPRGVRLCAQYPHVHYIEADLPDMAAHKRQLLQQHGVLGERHRVVEINILDHQGAQSVAAVFAQHLDPTRKTLVITEGLVNYFELAVISEFWQRLALALGGFPLGGYVTDLYPNLTGHPIVRLSQGFKRSLAWATRSAVTLHFHDTAAIQAGFVACGFATCTVHQPEAYAGVLPLPTPKIASLVRVVENWV
ncbi:MAG: hypothetical protein RL180_463 [Pseudomonadota bacterium]|jgi:O-methyltransferase involved in polyketide biosynthesis